MQTDPGQVPYLAEDLLRPPSDADFDRDERTGSDNRVCDTSRCGQPLGWEPQVPLRQDLDATIDWYLDHRDPGQVGDRLEHLLLERRHA